jgi:hypothetical protein
MLAKLLPLLPVILPLWLLAFRYWHGTIITVLIWMLFEGAARKWLLPEYQSQLLLVKDLVLIAAYVGYFFSPRPTLLGPKSRTLALLAFIQLLFCSFALLNPNSPSLLLSLFGLKNYLIYIPLAFIIPDMIVDQSKLRKVMLWSCYLTLPIALLGLYQFSQPPTARINKYVSHEAGVESRASVFGGRGEGEGFEYGRARTSSTFSYIGGFSTFLMFSAPMAASLLLAGIPRRSAMALVIAALASSLGAAATTGSRTPLLAIAVAIPLLLLIAASKKLLSMQLALRLAFGIALVGVGTLSLFGGAFTALEYRAETSDDPIVRLMSPVTETISAFQTSPLFGTGLGSNSNAAATVMGTVEAWWLDGNLYEVEPARIMQELGVIGCVLIYLPKVFVIILLIAQLRAAVSPLTIAAQMAALIFVLSHFVLFTVNNATGGLIYWSMVGLAIAARRIERARQQASAEQAYYIERGYPLGDVALA